MPGLGGAWSGGCLVWGVPGLGACSREASGLVAFWFKVAFWFGGLLVWWPSSSKWPSGLVAFWLKVIFQFKVAFWYGLLGGPDSYNRRPPHQKALPEGHNRRPLSTRRPPSIRRPPHQKALPEGHNRRPLSTRRPPSIRRPPHQKAFRSRATPKGEIEGDQVQCHTQGGN